MRASRRANATIAIFLPRRRSIACSQLRRAATRGSEDRYTRQAAWTSNPPHPPASLLLLPGAVPPRNQSQVAGDLRRTPRPHKSTDVIERRHKSRGGDRPDAGTGAEAFDDRVVRDQGFK